MMNPATEIERDRITRLAAEMIGAMVNAMNDAQGVPDSGLIWEQAVFAAALAINSIGHVAMTMSGLDEVAFREKILTAILDGLSTKVVAMQVESKEEFEQMVGDMAQPKH